MAREQNHFARLGRTAFTLIELLIVVAIIALLVSILLPSLTQARALTRRVICASNTRQIALGLHQYASDDLHGHFPASPSGQNASLTFELCAPPYGGQTDGDFAAEFRPRCFWGYDKQTGFFGMGLLYLYKFIDNPEAFYCPNVENSPYVSWPNGWKASPIPPWLFGGYYYRIFGQKQDQITPALTYDMIDKVLNLDMNAEEALVADVFLDAWWERGPQPHVDPFGVNVAFADGHATWVELGDKELARCAVPTGMATAYRDLFTYFYFRALGSGKFKELDTGGFPVP